MAFRTQETRKIRPSVGCGEAFVPSTIVQWYDLRNPVGHMGNVGSDDGAIWATSPWKPSCLGYIGNLESANEY